MRMVLAVAVLALGLWPKPLVDVMHASMENLLTHMLQSKL
jgi:NADH-quinone oxidoreductase subunit M